MSYTLNITGYYNADENMVEPITPDTTIADVELVSNRGKVPVYNAAGKKKGTETVAAPIFVLRKKASENAKPQEIKFNNLVPSEKQDYDYYIITAENLYDFKATLATMIFQDDMNVQDALALADKQHREEAVGERWDCD